MLIYGTELKTGVIYLASWRTGHRVSFPVLLKGNIKCSVVLRQFW